MLDRMTGVAAEDGLEFHFERVQSGNTFDAIACSIWRASAACRTP